MHFNKVTKHIAVILLAFFCYSNSVRSQILLSGTVYDSSKLYPLSGVMVKSTGGIITFTDSLGAYRINVREIDSISFSYMNKPTMKFPIRSITNYSEFDISLRVHVYQKYRPLKEIFIFSKSHKEDSAENRLAYSKVFNFSKPGIRSSYTPGSPAGFDLDELVNIFRFRHKKQMLAFQKRLIQQEQVSYINYRFSTTVIKRITGLSGEALQRYKVEYCPDYGFVASSDELEFYQYILNTSYQFRRQNGLPAINIVAQ